tara:strand:+ start:466 stop:723 length:258 start_codon:yes stop_codon:yes gene_type:complete
MNETRHGIKITLDEAEQLKKQGEKFFSPGEFAKLIGTSEKALRQMRWRAQKGKGNNYYPYYKFGHKILYPYSKFLEEAEKFKNVR